MTVVVAKHNEGGRLEDAVHDLGEELAGEDDVVAQDLAAVDICQRLALKDDHPGRPQAGEDEVLALAHYQLVHGFESVYVDGLGSLFYVNDNVLQAQTISDTLRRPRLVGALPELKFVLHLEAFVFLGLRVGQDLQRPKRIYVGRVEPLSLNHSDSFTCTSVSLLQRNVIFFVLAHFAKRISRTVY